MKIRKLNEANGFADDFDSADIDAYGYQSAKTFPREEPKTSDIVVFIQTPPGQEDDWFDTYYGRGNDYTFDKDGGGIVIYGNRDFESFGDDTLLKIVKGNYEGDENWNEEEGYYEDYDVLEMLEKVTGKEYDTMTMRGYSQSDWQTIYYPADKEEVAKDIETYYFGKYDEWWSEDEGMAVAIPHDIAWKGNEAIKNYIFDEIGIPVDKIKLRKYKGSHSVADYEDEIDESCKRKGKKKKGLKEADDVEYKKVYGRCIIPDGRGTVDCYEEEQPIDPKEWYRGNRNRVSLSPDEWQRRREAAEAEQYRKDHEAWLKKYGMKESMGHFEDAQDSPYYDLIIDKFGYEDNDEFLSIVLETLEGVSDPHDKNSVWKAVDEELIYEEDQWEVMKHYQTPDTADFDSAWGQFYEDMVDLCQQIAEEQE